MKSVPHLRADNRPLSDAEKRRGLAAIAAVRRCEEAQSDFVRRHGVDPEFCNAGKLWSAPVERVRRLAALIEKDPSNLDLLRFSVQVFTGFDLALYARKEEVPIDVWQEHWRKSGGIIVHPLEDGFDARLKARVEEAAHFTYWMELLRYTPMNLLFVPPTICGEVGTNINGIVVNHDTAVYQERLTLLGWLGIFRFLERRIASEGTIRILEIGGGYGALARQIKRIMPNVSYTICDLPASLYVSSAYLSVACPDLATHVVSEEEPGTEAIEAFHFLPNYALPVFAGDYRFDLVINTLSLAEMTAEQVGRYGALVARMISGSGMFFEQNRDNTPVGGVNCKELLQRHFLRRNHLPLPPFSALQGRIDVWSHRAFEFPFS